MIQNIYQNICELLGPKFQVYFFENANDLTEEENKTNKDKVVGVFYVSSADYKPLQGIQGLQGRGTLQLLVPVKNKDDFNATLYAFETLVANTNGTIQSDNVNYQYVLDWGYPTPMGNVDNIYGAKRQAYGMPFNFVISSQNRYGNDIEVSIDGSKLTGIVAWNYDSLNSLVQKLAIDEYQATNIEAMNDFALSLQCFVQDNALWQTLQAEARDRTKVTHEVIFTTNGITTPFTAVMSRYHHTGTLGQFQVSDLLFVPTEPEPTLSYSVTYLANGGTGELIDTNSPYADGSIVTVLANTFVKTNYRFIGWKTTDGESLAVGSTFIIHANTEILAQWEYVLPTYSVTYNGNGGTTSIIDTIEYESGTQVTLKFTPTPFRVNWAFLGWSTNANDITPTYTASGVTTATITSNLTFYAIWGYLTEFNGNGGTWGGVTAISTTIQRNTNMAVAYAKAQAENKVTGNPTSGMPFIAWNTKVDGTGSDISLENTPTQRFLLYAKYSPATVTYSANGGTGTTASQSGRVGTAISISANGFVRSGMSFVEWNTSADGNGNSYQQGNTYTLNSDITLYAIWRDEITLSYSGNVLTATSSGAVNTNVTVSVYLRTDIIYTTLNVTLTTGQTTASNTLSDETQTIISLVSATVTPTTFNGVDYFVII